MVVGYTQNSVWGAISGQTTGSGDSGEEEEGE